MMLDFRGQALQTSLRSEQSKKLSGRRGERQHAESDPELPFAGMTPATCPHEQIHGITSHAHDQARRALFATARILQLTQLFLDLARTQAEIDK